MRFAVDFMALGIVAAWLLVVLLLKVYLFSESPRPSLAFSRLRDLRVPSGKSRRVALPRWGHQAALCALMMAFVNPQVLWPESASGSAPSGSIGKEARAGIAIYLVLDQSGSMGQVVHQPNHDQNGPSKIEVLKQVTTQFVRDHPADLIGLVSFARVPRVLVPLTSDREILLEQLNLLKPVMEEDQDGTAMGYAVVKTASLMVATRHFAQQAAPPVPYKIQSAAMILVTDGFQNPSRLDRGNRLRTIELDDAAAYAKSQQVHLYIVNIDPLLATPAYAPQRRQLEAVAAETGGRFYLVDQVSELKEIYEDIGRLEKGPITPAVSVPKSAAEIPYRPFSLYSFCLVAGLGFLFIALLCDSLYLKTVP